MKIILYGVCFGVLLIADPMTVKADFDWVDCTPYRVAVKLELIHLGCENDSNWYGIHYTQDNKDLVNRVLSLANTAVVARKNVKLFADTSKTGWREITAIELFK